MKKTDTWMPLYIGDYLADTSRLTTEQHGAYLLLLMDYWRNGPPPDDDAVLASIAKLSTAQWKRHAPALKSFFVVEDGLWRQGRADAERTKANGVSDTRSAAGKAGAQRRWANSKEHGEGDGKRIANAMANASQNDAPSQSQSQEEKETPPSGTPLPASRPTTKGSRLPNDWGPGESGTAFAEQQGLRNGRAATELEKFRDYWAAQPGQKGVKADWQATWRNWVRKAAETPSSTAPPRRQSATDRQIETMNALTGRDRDHDRQRAPAADTIDIAARLVP